jgi:HAD superfamily hydrolase (TIGR01509 family)
VFEDVPVPAYEAVLFDMDGVTVETAGAWRELEQTEILPAATAGTAPADAIRALSVADAYDRLAAMETVDLTVDAATFDGLYTAHADEVYRNRARLMSGYETLLGTLDSEGLAVGLVSASRREWVDLVLDRFDLHDAYDVVVSSSDIDGPAKPEPDIYLAAATQVGVPPERCLAVEDSPHGIASATRAGATCLALRGAGNADSDLSAADAVVDSPAELRARLSGLLGLP